MGRRIFRRGGEKEEKAKTVKEEKVKVEKAKSVKAKSVKGVIADDDPVITEQSDQVDEPPAPIPPTETKSIAKIEDQGPVTNQPDTEDIVHEVIAKLAQPPAEIISKLDTTADIIPPAEIISKLDTTADIIPPANDAKYKPYVTNNVQHSPPVQAFDPAIIGAEKVIFLLENNGSITSDVVYNYPLASQPGVHLGLLGNNDTTVSNFDAGKTSESNELTLVSPTPAPTPSVLQEGHKIHEASLSIGLIISLAIVAIFLIVLTIVILRKLKRSRTIHDIEVAGSGTVHQSLFRKQMPRKPVSSKLDCNIHELRKQMPRKPVR
jgi:hypothetical protein